MPKGVWLKLIFLSPSLVRHRLSKSRWDRKRQQKSRKSEENRKIQKSHGIASAFHA